MMDKFFKALRAFWGRLDFNCGVTWRSWEILPRFFITKNSIWASEVAWGPLWVSVTVLPNE
jgi:hypothetical protein